MGRAGRHQVIVRVRVYHCDLCDVHARYVAFACHCAGLVREPGRALPVAWSSSDAGRDHRPPRALAAGRNHDCVLLAYRLCPVRADGDTFQHADTYLHRSPEEAYAEISPIASSGLNVAAATAAKVLDRPVPYLCLLFPHDAISCSRVVCSRRTHKPGPVHAAALCRGRAPPDGNGFEHAVLDLLRQSSTEQMGNRRRSGQAHIQHGGDRIGHVAPCHGGLAAQHSSRRRGIDTADICVSTGHD
mmetsp:Transcript_884/g.1768  ORF Transcript_884/g.1768 Transcript_884/m.1768 type:complete len:244 (-) Transcript_884:2524-3255(-)